MSDATVLNMYSPAGVRCDLLSFRRFSENPTVASLLFFHGGIDVDKETMYTFLAQLNRVVDTAPADLRDSFCRRMLRYDARVLLWGMDGEIKYVKPLTRLFSYSRRIALWSEIALMVRRPPLELVSEVACPPHR